MTVKQNKSISVQVALSAIMAALVCAATMLIQIPNPPTKGYINIGDAMIFVSALSFGVFVGGVAGAVGSSLSDILSGYAFYAPFTFVIKGAEGLLAASIANRKSVPRDIVAVIIAGVEMILGYFLAEFFPLQYGWAALTEVPGNISQIVVGGIIGIPLTIIIRRRLPEVLKQ
jgi:uncharacterized membrane protein